MKRRVYIQFHSKYLITVTNYLKQKKIDISGIQGKCIDLVWLNVIDADTAIGIKDGFIAEVWDGSLNICYSDKKDSMKCIGSASVGEFEYYYNNPSNNKSNNVNEGTFEVTIK